MEGNGKFLQGWKNKGENPPPQSRPCQDQDQEEDKGRLKGLMEAPGDLDCHVSQHVRITSQFIVIPAVNNGLGDGDFE